MKLTLKPTVTAVLLAISGYGATSTFEVVKRKQFDTNVQKQASNPKTLKLNAAEFDPVFEKIILPELAESMHAVSQYGLVQFYQNNTNAANKIESLGAKILGYLPHDTYIVQWDKSVKAQLLNSKEFRYVGNYQKVYKLSPVLWNSVKSIDKSKYQSLTIELMGFNGVNTNDLIKLIQKYSPDASIANSKAIDGMPYVRLTVNKQIKEVVLNLAGSEQVMWIDKYLPVKIHNIDSVGPIQSNSAEITDATIWNRGIIGTGQIVAVADSGLDRNQDFFSQYDTGTGTVTKKYTDAVNTTGSNLGEMHPDNKVIGYFVQPGASAYDNDEECDEDSGGTGFHGTHVVSTVAGDSGTAATSSHANYDNGDGMAPHAQILFQDLGNSQTGCLSGEGGYDMFVQAAKAGAGISSNSYGTAAEEDAAADGYKYNDYEVDKASYDIEDLLIIFAAGNDGDTGLGHPGHAKNGLAVGALGHGDSTLTAMFSSRGPSYDGRVKPDIMAPGFSIVSAAGNTDNAIPPSQTPTALSTKSGTSMATPTVAGGAALMRQYFMDGFYPDGSKKTNNALKPSGALMKATLLNGTRLRIRTPSTDQGWGRIFLDNNLYFSGDSRDLRVWDLPHSNGLSTGDEMIFDVEVPAGEPFRATLSWFDPPAALGNGKALINDLDLEVRFNGRVYKGNNWSFGESVEGGQSDDRDTVEQIHIAEPEAGVYQLVVKGTQVNGIGTSATRKQGFALVSSQKHCDTGVSGGAGLNVIDSLGGDPLVVVDPIAGVDDYQVYRKPGGCGANNDGYKFVGQMNAQNNGGSFIDFGTISGETYGYAVRGVDVCGEAEYSSCQSIVSNAACALEPQFNTTSVQVSNTNASSCGVTLQWSNATNQCGNDPVKYNIYRSTEANFNPNINNRIATAVSGGVYNDLTVQSGQVYQYIVTAVDALGNESIHQNAQSILTSGDNFTAGDYQDDPDGNTLALLDVPWTISSSWASTGNQSFHNAQDGFNYSANTCAFVTLPEIQLQSGASLNYDVRYQLEALWDGVVVQISTNGGETWMDLPPDGGYPSSFAATEPTPGQPINACGFRSTQGAFSGSQSAFVTKNTDLSAFAGEKAIIRWGFSSDPGSEEDGFYLDNIHVNNASSPGVCEVAAINKNTSGPWYNPAENGHGFFLELIPGTNGGADRLNSYWYTYLDGAPRWVFGNAPVNGNSVDIPMFITSGPVSPPNYDANDLNIEPWGDLTFDFTSEIAGNLTWDSQIDGYGSGTMPINKIANVSNSPKACLSGSYSNSSQSGHGYVVEIVGAAGSESVLISWYSYDAQGEQIWLLGQAPLEGDTATVPVNIFSGTDFPPNFNAADVVSEPWGTLFLDFSAVNKMLVTWETSYQGYENGQINTDKFTLLKGKGCY
ncbi:MAG: S8 family serine peptidase [Marinicella sp.]